MKPLVGFAEALRLDASTMERFGLSGDLLMEAAATGMAAAIESDGDFRRAMDSSPVQAVAVCGGGNNGGDALAVLRRLAFSGRTGLAAIVPEKLGETASRRLDEAVRCGVTVIPAGDDRARTSIAQGGIVLDACTGIGFRGRRRPDLVALTSLVSLAKGPVIAIDTPSGIGPLASVDDDPENPPRAEATLCVEPLKAEVYYLGNRRHAGRVIPVPGVFPRSAGSGSSAALLGAEDLADHLPALDYYCHKGGRGALGVFAGAPGSTGAAALCARAASAAGSGSVTLLVRDALVPVMSSLLVSQMVRPVSDPGTRRYSAVVAGPGWGMDDANARALDGLWEAAMPLLLDADALRLLAAAGKAPRCSPLILTPHPGEFTPLAAVAAGRAHDDPAALDLAMRRAMFDSGAAVTEVASRFGAVVVLKGAVTWIGDPDGRLAVWDGREPTLATAGSGDVLAGLAGGFLARGASAWNAAVAAVIVHGLAGRAASTKGFYEADALVDEAARLAYGRIPDGNQG